MVRDDVGGRIEIELVEHAPTRPRTRSEPAPPGPPAPDDDHAGYADHDLRPTSTGRRVAVAAAAVGVAVGALAGWMIADDGSDEFAAPATTSPTATSAPPATFAGDSALVEPDRPAAPERRRPTTTTVPEVQWSSPIPDVAAALVGLPYEIVTDSGSGDLRFIDLASNTFTMVAIAGGSDTGQLLAGDGWVLVPNASTGAARVYTDGDPDPRVLDDLNPWSLFHAPGAATFWRPDQAVSEGLPGNMVEVDATGTPTGAVVAVPYSPIAVDASGAFLVQAPGGTYVLSGEATRRLNTGSVIARGPTTVLAVECDEVLVCTHVVVDRATGAHRELALDLDGTVVDQLGWWGQSDSVAPDGSVAILTVSRQVPDADGPNGVARRSELVAVDLVTGGLTAIDVGTEPYWFLSGITWTADSQYAFFLDKGEVLAYSRATGEVLRAGPDERSTSRPQAIAVRPSDGVPWAER